MYILQVQTGYQEFKKVKASGWHDIAEKVAPLVWNEADRQDVIITTDRGTSLSTMSDLLRTLSILL